MTVSRVPAALAGASFSDAVVVEGPGRWVHVAGQVGMDDEGHVVPGGVGAESEATFDRIERILKQAGASLDDVVRMTVYLTDLGRYGEFGAVRARRCAASLPASAAVGVASLLLGAQVEIEAVAFVTAP